MNANLPTRLSRRRIVFLLFCLSPLGLLGIFLLEENGLLTSRSAARRTIEKIFQDKVEPSEIVSARKVAGGWEPTYLCVLQFADDQRATTFLDKLGLNVQRDLTDRRLEIERVESVAPSEFQAFVKGDSVVVFVGIHGPYHTKAFLNQTNIILLLDRF